MSRRALEKLTPRRQQQVLRKRALKGYDLTTLDIMETQIAEYTNRVESIKQFQLASFRLEGGDAILRLSHRAEDTLLVHSAVLKKFPYFNATLSGRWGRPVAQLAVPPDVADESIINVWQYSLMVTEEKPIAFFLQCHTESPTEINIPEFSYWDSDYNPFYMSEYAIGFFRHGKPYDATPPGFVQLQAVKAHKVLLRLLYGLYVDMEFASTSGIAIEVIADVVAYSEFYGMLDVLAPGITKLLLTIHGLWKDVAEEPLFYLALAAKLHCECLYDDALKHLISTDAFWTREPWNGLDPAQRYSGFDGQLDNHVFDFRRLETYVLRQKLQLQERMRYYVDELRGIGSTITPPRYPCDHQWDQEITISLRKSDGRCRWIARSIYNEWFVRSFSYYGGNIRVWNHRDRDSDSNKSFKSACEQIIKYGSRIPPDITIFGNYEYFMLLGQHDCPINHRRDPFLCLKQELTKLLLEAKDAVETTGPHHIFNFHAAHYETAYFTGFPNWNNGHFYPWERPFTGLETDEDQEYSYEWDMIETRKENAEFRSVLDTVQIESASPEWAKFVSVPEVEGNELILSADNSLGLVTLELGHGQSLPWDKPCVKTSETETFESRSVGSDTE